MAVNQINHVDVEALIPQEERAEVFAKIVGGSKVLPLLTRLPNISTNKERLRIADSLPITYWLGQTGDKKKATKFAFKSEYLTAEEIACIIPISINDLEDANFDLWGYAKDRVVEAMGKVIDETILFGKNKPSSFPAGIVDLAYEYGHHVVQGGSESFYSVLDRAMEKVENTGYEVSGVVGGLGIKSAFRKLTDTTGQLIVGSEINELPKFFVNNGAWDNSKAKLVLGDFKQAVYAVRDGLKFKLLEEATIVDPVSGDEIHLAQEDKVALRCTLRIGWACPTPVTPANEDDRLGFSVVSSSATKKITLTGPESATFADSVDVSLSANVLGAKIYYTNDGSAPDATDTLYTAPIKLTATKTIKAIAIYGDYTSSDVYSATFTKGE